VDILEPLPREEIERLRWRLPVFRLERGELCYAPGDPADRLFLLHEGRVRLYKPVGGREFTLAVVGPGTVFGEMSLTGSSRQGAYAEALEPAEVSVLGKEDLRRLIREHPEVGIRLITLLSRRLRDREERLAEMAGRDVTERLAALLARLAEEEGVVTQEGYRIPFRYTHRQLGSMIGANREAVTKALGRLRKSGAVAIADRRLAVRDLGLLKKLAGYVSEDT
jgi:CRP/FNR family cyclic AMP-dependent transcriptional regulator